MLFGIGAFSTALSAVSPVPLEVEVVNGHVVDCSPCREKDALPGQQRYVVFNDDVVHRDDGQRLRVIADVDEVNLRLRPCSSLVFYAQRGVETADLGVGAKRGFEVGGSVVAKHPSIGDRGIEIRQAVVGERQAPCIKPCALELDVLPSLNLRDGNATVGHRLHVVQHLR